MTRRRQATLYVPPLAQQSAFASPTDFDVESLRKQYNPAQANLISAHVTLCREDEVSDWSELQRRLEALEQIDVPLQFAKLVRDDNLVYLATDGNDDPFHALRHKLLATKDSSPRNHQPHLTLIHPRNGSCDDQTFLELTRSFAPFQIRFNAVTLIEQYAAGNAWNDLVTHPAR